MTSENTSSYPESSLGLTSSTTGSFYFAYGSNLSSTQMSIRCHNDPSSSQPCAIARLDNYDWIICERGYANIVALPSLPSSDHHLVSDSTPNGTHQTTVYGLLYNLHPADEARLDLYEGHNHLRNPTPTPNPDSSTRSAVPFLQGEWDYNKHYLPITITKWLIDPSRFGLTSNDAEQVTTLIYVDELRIARGTINEEYIGRMNRGIREAVALGLDEEWVEEVMRRDIPREGEVREEGYVGEVEGYVSERKKWEGVV